MRAGVLAAVLLGGVVGGPASSSAQPAPDHPVDRFPDVLEQYRRVELLVPGGFGAACERVGGSLVCRLSGMPESFIKVLRALRGGAIEKVDIRGRRGLVFEVRLELKRPDLDFRSVVLAAPARWVLEVGLPLTMSDPVEDEVPFRPYPVEPGAFEPGGGRARLRRGLRGGSTSRRSGSLCRGRHRCRRG
jgi:hypothetical protein